MERDRLNEAIKEVADDITEAKENIQILGHMLNALNMMNQRDKRLADEATAVIDTKGSDVKEKCQ
jgi:hypothetical protein